MSQYTKQREKNKHRYLFVHHLLLLIILQIALVGLESTDKLRNLKSNDSEIHLIIEGSGDQNILNDQFTVDPSEVFVNGIKDDSCKKKCVLPSEKNNVTIKFTNQIESTEIMFENLQTITQIDLSDFDMSKVSTMKNMFRECTNLEEINFGNINTSSVESLECLFYRCTNLKSIDLSKFETSKVTTMFGIFTLCINLEKVNFGNINTSSVVNMRSMFSYCYNLISIDLSSFDTSKVINLQWFFYHCHSIISIDMSNFDFSKVTTMYSMFKNCYNLEKVNFGSINTSSLEDMESLFYGCTNLTSVDLSKFDTSKVTSFFGLFALCTNLETVKFGKMNTSLVENMRSVFNGCNNLSVVDLSSFDTSRVTTFQWMFFNCRNLKYLNISHFNTSRATNMFRMFRDLSSLIYLNFFSLELNNSINDTRAFNDLSNDAKYCIEDDDTKNYILEKAHINSICSDPCFNPKNKKVDIINKTCIESCEQNGFGYEYNTLCYEDCPNDTYTLFNERNEHNNNVKECFAEAPEGYYLDSEEKKYKKCYETCKLCDIGGNEVNNNCIECKDNFRFYENKNNITNCYQLCEKYYYFADLSFTCTETLECPENYNKLISNQKKCIDECRNDYIYKYEYKNECYKECPKGTHLINENDYICQDFNPTTEYFAPSSISYNNEKSTFIEETSFITINNENITQTIIKTSSNTKIVFECNTADELNNNCNFLNIQNNSEIINIIKDNINLIYNPESGKSQIIKGENDTVFQITNAKNEKELLEDESLNNQNISIIDLGQCEIKLKKEYNINDNDSLIYLKQENTNAKANEKNIQYEIYEPYNFTKLNLSICEEETINIYVKLDLSEETRNTYELLKSLGYDMLNINDPFYQDVCVPYKSDNNTDMLLSDRIDYIYNNKDSQCQPNCEFSSYLPNSLYLNCTCSATENKEEDNKKKFSGKKLYESFYDILKYSNFEIMKCYKLTFNSNIFFQKNIGNAIILSIFSAFLICLIIFIIKGTDPLLNKLRNTFYNNNEITGKKDVIIVNNIIIANNQSQANTDKMLPNPKKKRKSSINKTDSKRRKKKSTTYIVKNIDNQETIKVNLLNNSGKNNLSVSSKVSLTNQEKKEKIEKEQIVNPDGEGEEEKKFATFELNQLEYHEAILYDKRTFLKTYLDILYREHKIIFTFFIYNDYNLSYIKYARFIFLFATDMALNVFFFSDESMHKVFLNYGKYNFIQQIPQIVYTTIVSQLIEVFLCYLSLTDKYIYKIKNLTKSNHNNNKNEILKVINYMKIKLIIFFIFTSIFFGLYWYIITSFCAVYENTQVTFLKDSLLSFLIGIIYPFILYLIPSGLRILSLRHSKKNLKCIYRLSDIIPFF